MRTQNCIAGIHTKQHGEVEDNHVVVTCRDCEAVLYDGDNEGIEEWLEGGPAPWSEIRNGLVYPPPTQ